MSVEYFGVLFFMIRIIVGPDAIKKEGLDKITKSLVKRLYKYTDEPYCEVLFLIGVKKEDISYMMRQILRVLDMGMTIMTRVDVNDIQKNVDFQGNELEVTLRVT